MTLFNKQRGAALFISLMFLIILTLIGLSAANVGIMQERMASNVAQSNVAFQRAEATLRSVEQGVVEIAGGGSGGLGQIPIWADVHDDLGISRGDCTLSGAGVDDWTWETPPDAGDLEGDARHTIVELSGATAGGEIFGSTCRPMQGSHKGNPGEVAVYYLIGARAKAADEKTEAVVQSIFFYP